MKEPPVIIETGDSKPDCAVIWLHGLGADGHDFEGIVPELDLPKNLSVRFVFPHAPMQAVTINNGYVMRAWYDILGLDIASAQDEQGIRNSQNLVNELIRSQCDQGIESKKIVLAGFSQGGAITLQTGLRYAAPLAGLMVLSSYLPLSESVVSELQPQAVNTPVFMAHGDSDTVIPPELGLRSRSRLETLGLDVEWHEYAQLAHGINLQEINDISRFLRRCLT